MWPRLFHAGVGMVRKSVVALALTAFVLAIILAGLWGSLALFYRAPFGDTARTMLAGVFALGMVVAAVLVATRRFRMALLPLAAFPALLVWWSTLTPSNHREWAVDVSRPAVGSIEGDRLVMRNVRNFEWRTESEFTPRWEERTYDLAKLSGVDLVASYWAGEDIAHILLSFGFTGGERLVWSIELRRTATQSYSALASFFRQSELVFIAADERDIIRLRTNVRGETVRMYPLRMREGVARRLLAEYVEMANQYAREPGWYNTVTANCTTMVFRIARALNPVAPFDWRVLLSGHFPELVYDHGGIDNAIPFASWRAKAEIAGAAKAADALDSQAFSEAIRAQLALR